MRQLVAKETIPFQGEPLKGVQLMGILESRTLDFKNVIILSVNEGKLPKGKSVNSFIPYDIKKYFKLPTYTESDAVFSYHFYRLLQRANNISLIYNSETDDFGSGEKSRFITQLLAEYNGEIEEYVYKAADLEEQYSNQIVIQNRGLKSKIKSWREKGVSPSALNTYNNCSLQFYYHYLAKIRIDNEVDEYADASIMGTAIHDALDINYPIGVITEKDVANITNAILTDIENNFVAILSEQGMMEGKNYLSLQIAYKLTKNFLKLEKQLIVEANKRNQQIKIIEKEADLSYNLLVDDVSFKLNGKADRVDLEGDTLRIIDYKTGKVEQSEIVFAEFDELIDNPKKSKAFQLLMYAYLYLKMHPNYIGLNVIAGNFSFKNLKLGLLKVSKKVNSKQSEVININQAILDEFEAQLEVVLKKINNNPFSQTLEVKHCEWCDYKSICKR
jgi:CRISPR/Cas system-associated exonuclease Cas4 (RecB family)